MLINQIEQEKKNKNKWWIIPKFDIFENYDTSVRLNYYIEEEQDCYSKNRPPLKSGFNSNENLKLQLSKIMNNYGIDTERNTPDYILAEYLIDCLKSYKKIQDANMSWHGWHGLLEEI